MDTKRLWKKVLAELELSVSKATYKTHFASASLVSFENNVATIGFTSPLMRSLVESRYYSLIKSVLDHHADANTSLLFVVTAKREKMTDSQAGPLFAQKQHTTTINITDRARALHIRPDFTFETFAVSTSNQMAHAAATAIVENPGTAYNPLFLHGGVGVGKTHLMHAIANALLAKNPRMNIVSCMGEEFLNEIIEAIQTKTATKFKQKYRSAKLLLVDDVQFIAGKQTAQEEFFHTFNAVHRAGGQIVLTSDRSPSEISRLEERLRSRFEGGLIVDVARPGFELRTAITNIKAKALGLTLPSDVAQLVASNIDDTRAIEGFLRRLHTEVSTKREDPTHELVTQLLGAKQPVRQVLSSNRVSPQDVLQKVATHFGLKTTALKGPKRSRPIARSRQVVMYLCKTELGLTLKDIGGMLGGRDHTTVMHGVETITRELSTNDRLREEIAGIKQTLWEQL